MQRGSFIPGGGPGRWATAKKRRGVREAEEDAEGTLAEPDQGSISKAKSLINRDLGSRAKRIGRRTKVVRTRDRAKS